MTVYFDRTKGAAKEDAADDLQKEIKNKRDIAKGAEVLANFTRPLALMLLWNWIMPGLFGLATIGYLQAFGLYVMSRLLFNHKEISVYD
tara:strand:- start:364 stop:630 length:267 start_codon:yes stop_codon:yes gene_type:complete